MKQQVIAALVATAFAILVSGCATHKPMPQAPAKVVKTEKLAFVPGATGSDGDVLARIDQMVVRVHEMLAAEGLGIGNMIQHTLYLKEGAIEPLAFLQRFHAKARELAPSLVEHPSVGTLLRVPRFADPDTLVMIDLVAGIPSTPGRVEQFKRVLFTFGPQEIAESLAIDGQVLVSGTEALNFETGDLPEDIDEQVEATVFKLNNELSKMGLTFNNMVSHNLYIVKGVNVGQVIQKLHQSIKQYAPDAYAYPGVGAIAVVDGMALAGFKLEIDLIAATGDPASYPRVPLSEVTNDVSRSVEVDGLVYLSSMPGTDFADNMHTPDNVYEQVDIAVKNVQLTLEKSGLSVADMVKHKLYLKIGAGNPNKVRRRFYQALRQYAPDFEAGQSAETFIIVESLASPDRLFELHATAARRPGR